MFKLKKAVARSAAITTVAMSLAAGMALQEAAPAQAFVPLLAAAPAVFGVISGGTATAGGVTLGGMLGVTGIMAAAGGLGMWLTSEKDTSFNFPWEQDANAHRGFHDNGAPIVTEFDVNINPYAPENIQKKADLVIKETLLFSRWAASSTAGAMYFAGTDSAPGGSGGNAVRGMMWLKDVVCKNSTTGAIVRPSPKLVTMGTYQEVANQPSYRSASGNVTACASTEKVMRATIDTPTLAQKHTIIPVGTAYYTYYKASPQTLTYQDKAYSPTDPTYQTTVSCVKPDGSRTIITEERASTSGEVPVPSCAARGLGVAESIVTNFLDGGKISGAPLLDIFTGDKSYTDCDVALGKVCKMEIFIDGQVCQTGLAACISWLGLHRVNPGRVECRYGGKLVDISGCFILEGAYITGGTPYVQENVDGDPETWRPPRIVPGWQWPEGSPEPVPPTVDPDPEIENDIVADPEPEPPTDPDPQPSSTANPTPTPSPSATATSGPTGEPQPPTVQTPKNPEGEPGANQENCLEQAVSWNPIDWVLVPVKCALQWAFVPKTPIQATIQGMGSKFDGKVPMAWFGTPASAIGGGGCPTDWAVTLNGDRHSLICGTAADSIIQGFRPVLGAMLIVAALWPLVRSLFYAAIPIFKVNPS